MRNQVSQLCLSEAIRLGAMQRPQFFGGALSGTLPDGRVGTCAIGAALEAIGVQLIEFDAINAPAPWSDFVEQVERCPAVECAKRNTIAGVAAHLNDFHRWTREAIADWVEQMEAKHLPAVVQEQAEPVCV
jgi:hypothetical protein